MTEQKLKHSDLTEFLSVLKNSSIKDLEFSESEPFGHSDPHLSEKKIGCRLVAVRGVKMPYPGIIAYVRATDLKRGAYRYVIDNSQCGQRAGHSLYIQAKSEDHAKQVVLSRLQEAIVKMLKFGPEELNAVNDIFRKDGTTESEREFIYDLFNRAK